MATITMDTSEYEALKKNISLLEEAKEKEQVLNNQIQKLKDEKIEALKNNEKSVTIIKKKVITEFVRQNVPSNVVFEGLKTLINSYRCGNHRAMLGFTEESNALRDMFFTKEQMVSHPEAEETITVKGLDEYKEEMREEYFESLTRETLDTLKKVTILEVERAKFLPELEKFKESNLALIQSNNALRLDLEKLSKERDELNVYKTNSTFISHSNWTIWNFKDKQLKLRGCH